MAAPSVYTEKTLAEFMAAELGKIGTGLSYTVGVADAGSYAEAVNETLLRYGVTSISAATEILKLRALARVQAWRKACNDLASNFNFSSDGSKFERQAVYRQALVNLDSALVLAAEWDTSGAYEISVTRINPVNDPYRYRPEEMTTL